MNFRDAMLHAAALYGVAFTPAQLERYELYFSILLEWNQKMNLTAITEPRQVAVKHMIDSISCYDAEIFGKNARVIDVGTGAGFPGLPLKLWREDIQLTLMDSISKRTRFLQAVVDELHLADVEIVHSRAEDGAKNRNYRAQYDIAVSRAVANLSILAEYCLPFVARGSWFIALKGSKYRAELDEAQDAIRILGGKLEKVLPVQLPDLDDGRAVLYIKKVRDTPASYPRKAGMPEKKPLSGQKCR